MKFASYQFIAIILHNLMPFAENFKDKKHSSIVSSFINKYQDELQSKKFSQDEVIDYLENEKNAWLGRKS